MSTMMKPGRIVAIVLFSSSLTACAGTMDRLSNIGEAPQMAAITNPHLDTGYKPVSMPMPEPQSTVKQPNSLWLAETKTFFKDQRAASVGDIMTVLIDIKDEADLENSSERSRTANEGAGLDSFLGYEQALGAVLPEVVDNENLIAAESDSQNSGEGKIEREEEIKLRLAATITQILPNGNMVIQGSQEVRVNFEKRILNIAGVIRPQDISVNNTINYDQIAEARIVYGGEGHITDVQQPRYGQQVYDVLFPF